MVTGEYLRGVKFDACLSIRGLLSAVAERGNGLAAAGEVLSQLRILGANMRPRPSDDFRFAATTDRFKLIADVRHAFANECYRKASGQRRFGGCLKAPFTSAIR